VRKYLDRIKDRLRSFIAQRDDFALVVGCSSEDSLLALKMLEGLAEASTSEMFWTCIDAFTTPAEYAQAVVGSFAVKHKAVTQALQKEGRTPWPPLPGRVASKETAPAERLRALMVFSRSLLSVLEGGLTVWVLLPLEVVDAGAFAALVRDVIDHEFPFPWCHHLRLVVRDDPRAKALSKLLEQAPRVQWLSFDLSLPTMEKAMEEEVTDETLPLDQRMANLLVLAGVDFAQKRYADAVEKYELLARYHGAKGNQQLVALALNGIGEVHYRKGELDQAGKYFQEALPAASASLVPSPVLFSVTLNLANLRAEQGHWGEAEGYHECAERLAMMARNVGGKLQAMEKRGLSQYKQQKITEALTTWQQGADMAEKLNQDGSRQSMLKRLEEHYRRTKDKSKLDEVRHRLSTGKAAVEVREVPGGAGEGRKHGSR
jgi:tetratricopeptide (TPR) repeat protein